MMVDHRLPYTLIAPLDWAGIVEMGNSGKVDVLSTLLRAIDERDSRRNRGPVARTVLERRHGLRSGSVETLETIGNDLSLTRERIRQIESRAMRALRGEDSLGPEVDAIRGGLRSKFDEILLSLGGAGTGAEVDEHMGPYLDLAAFSMSMALAFLAGIAGFSMEPPKEEGKSWVLFSSDEAQRHVKSATDSLVKLAWEIPGILVDKALAQVAASLNVPKDSVETALRVDERLRIGPSGGIYVVRGISGIRHADRIAMVLRSIGKPAHFRTIKKGLQDMFPATGNMSEHNVLSALGNREPELFRRVGRGTFGLAEWGLPFASNSLDLARQILESEMRWMCLRELTLRMKKIGWQYQAKSIGTALDLEDQRPNRIIRRVRDSRTVRYGIASWVCHES